MKHKNILVLISTSAVIWATHFTGSTQREFHEYVRSPHPRSAMTGLFDDDITSSKGEQDDSIPEVELVLAENPAFFSWGSQVRYTINVSDKKDGQSKYGEINANEVTLKIAYLPVTDNEQAKEKIMPTEKQPEPEGLLLMKRSTCFGCHADKTRLSGPSFLEIAQKYENISGNIESLASSISGGSSGNWGNAVMPAHPDFTAKESQQIAAYILEQGARKNNWILPGLEGAFQIIKKPADSENGMYVLTATYTSQSEVTGQTSLILHIK